MHVRKKWSASVGSQCVHEHQVGTLVTRNVRRYPVGALDVEIRGCELLLECMDKWVCKCVHVAWLSDTKGGVDGSLNVYCYYFLEQTVVYRGGNHAGRPCGETEAQANSVGVEAAAGKARNESRSVLLKGTGNGQTGVAEVMT